MFLDIGNVEENSILDLVNSILFSIECFYTFGRTDDRNRDIQLIRLMLCQLSYTTPNRSIWGLYGLARSRTEVKGFKVLCANHYTT